MKASYSTHVVLHSLLQECSAKSRADLIKQLSLNEREALESLPKPFGNPLQEEDSVEVQLSRIHPSWISPFLRVLPEKEIGFFLSSLNPTQAIPISKDLLFTSKLPSISLLAKSYFQKTLLGYLTAEIEELLPISALPESPLNSLVNLKNVTFNQVLDHLGLYDISVELPQIIEKKKLNKLYNSLTSSQLNYLKILLKRHQPIPFARIGLVRWNEDPEKLRALVRKMGAYRLGKALYGQNPSLIWHLLHKLEVERAFLVQKFSTPLKDHRIVLLIIRQILEFMTYIKEG